jgi:predicted RNA binding protein YcfA (HicA-like mRNA interferase family)
MKTADRELARELQADGWELLRNRRHLVWAHPSGARLVTPRSGSDGRRGHANVRAQARRALQQVSQ